MKEVETKIRNFSSEVRERTIDILKTIEVDEHGEVYQILETLSPKVIDEVLKYLTGIEFYINEFSDVDSIKKRNLQLLKGIFQENHDKRIEEEKEKKIEYFGFYHQNQLRTKMGLRTEEQRKEYQRISNEYRKMKVEGMTKEQKREYNERRRGEFWKRYSGQFKEQTIQLIINTLDTDYKDIKIFLNQYTPEVNEGIFRLLRLLRDHLKKLRKLGLLENLETEVKVEQNETDKILN